MTGVMLNYVRMTVLQQSSFEEIYYRCLITLLASVSMCHVGKYHLRSDILCREL